MSNGWQVCDWISSAGVQNPELSRSYNVKVPDQYEQ